MQQELIIFLVMIGSFLFFNFITKLPVSLSMVIASILGAVVAGDGIPLRHLFEGTFTYIDTMLIISTAMIFMETVQKSGAMDALNVVIVNKFHKKPAIMLILLMLMIMFPGMVTGSSTAAVLSSGSIVAPILLLMGIPAPEAGAIIAIGAIMGMAAPPVNIPAMLIAGGVDMPYIGFEGPLLVLTLLGGIFTVLFIGKKYAKNLNYDTIKDNLNTGMQEKYGFKLYIPILLVITLIVLTRALPTVIPNLGMPLIFMIGTIIGLFTGEKVDFYSTIKGAIKTSVPVLGKLIGVGMFIQIMTLTGVRGLIVIQCLGLSTAMLYLAIVTVIPAFGAVSSYGAASVLGVPILLALISGNQIIVASALAFICCLGDLMPPTALAGNYAAQIVNEKYSKVLKHCIIPFIFCAILGLIMLIFSNKFAFLI